MNCAYLTGQHSTDFTEKNFYNSVELCDPVGAYNIKKLFAS